MAADLDQLSAELTDALTLAADTRVKTRSLHAAAHQGDAGEVRRIAETMTTPQLQNLKQQLER